MPQPKRKSHRPQLLGAMRDHRAIRFSTRFEVGRVRGYVLDVGPSFFLLALVSDGIRFNGFGCFGVTDVKNLEPDPYAAFGRVARPFSLDQAISPAKSHTTPVRSRRVMVLHFGVPRP